MWVLIQSVSHSSIDSLQRLNMTYWMNFVASYFTEKSTMKLTLWKDNQQVEAKPFGARGFILNLLRTMH